MVRQPTIYGLVDPRSGRTHEDIYGVQSSEIKNRIRTTLGETRNRKAHG